jgi:hypothetical protein
MSKATGAGRRGIKSAGRRGGPDRPAKGVKVADSAAAKTKGHRGITPGPVRTTAQSYKVPHEEAPWPMAKSKKL